MSIKRVGTAVVVGGGAVGLSTARALLASKAAEQVFVLESASKCGQGTSARSSGVLHAGMYHPSDKLKAQLAIEGRQMLVDLLEKHKIDYELCGKMVVANSTEEMERLNQLYHQGLNNGLDQLKYLTATEAAAQEPQLRCMSALYSPYSGVFDSAGAIQALNAEVDALGGTVCVNASVNQIRLMSPDSKTRFVVDSSLGELPCDIVVNSAGHYAPYLAASCVVDDANRLPFHLRGTPRAVWYAKGNYFRINGLKDPPFNSLIYPIATVGGLGIHATRDTQGAVHFGPDVEWIAPNPEYAQVGLQAGMDMAADHFARFYEDGQELCLAASTAHDARVPPPKFDYNPNATSCDSFYQEIERYWPDVRNYDLQPDYAGIRPKITGGDTHADFLVHTAASHKTPGLVNLFGVESPGWTAALALGEHVTNLLQTDQA